MDISSVTNTSALQAYTKASTVERAPTLAPETTSSDTQAITPETNHPSNPVNASSAPVPKDNTAPVYTAVGNANASIIRGSGIDITT
jgi:hypothetical protein